MKTDRLSYKIEIAGIWDKEEIVNDKKNIIKKKLKILSQVVSRFKILSKVSEIAMVDEKELLMKYIKHVGQCESCFLEDIDFKRSSNRVHFSQEEIDTLRLLASQMGFKYE